MSTPPNPNVSNDANASLAGSNAPGAPAQSVNPPPPQEEKPSVNQQNVPQNATNGPSAGISAPETNQPGIKIEQPATSVPPQTVDQNAAQPVQPAQAPEPSAQNAVPPVNPNTAGPVPPGPARSAESAGQPGPAEQQQAPPAIQPQQPKQAEPVQPQQPVAPIVPQAQPEKPIQAQQPQPPQHPAAQPPQPVQPANQPPVPVLVQPQSQQPQPVQQPQQPQQEPNQQPQPQPQAQQPQQPVGMFNGKNIPQHMQSIPPQQQMMMGFMPMYPYNPQFPQPPMGYNPQQQHPQPPQPMGIPPQNSALPPGSVANEYRPLNVKDALSYLDMVKNHFNDQPDVYNHFLDIMKDFKSHNIDTPGVIDRVSSLFRGHPNLIQGFNTFLPVGYSIHCSSDPNDPNPVKVTTPMGSQTISQMNAQNQLVNANQKDGQAPFGFINGQQPAPQASQSPAPAQAQLQGQPGAPVPPPNAGAAQAPPATSQDKQGPVEFGHAVTYVNQIKNHYSQRPDIYKHFLEVLQTYQREQLKISEVYALVRNLFKDAPELIEGFRNFLPDAVESGNAQQSDDMRLPPLGNFGPSSASTVPRESSVSVLTRAATSRHENFDQQQPQFGQSAQSNLRGDAPMGSNSEPGVNIADHSDEIAFFDKVKKQIPRQSYLEFLKTLNLFTQRIIDLPTLVDQVGQFLSPYPEMFDWFRNFLGYTGEPLHIENIAQRKHAIDLSQCRSYGRSYRLLPKTERFMPCSGRDDLCWEVLNDEWVGHPTWASEDSGYVAHRKNQYEEILYRVEEERHEYDHYMGANQRTIQVLETINDKINSMTQHELATFKLPEGLGQGTKIYQKVIRKIYDRKNGNEVIAALHEKPSAAVPIVLKRLKQKDEEWHRAHREWNKVWRDAERRAFYRSLDHIGLTFKQTDRKHLTPRYLLAEIVAVKAEQGAKRKANTLGMTFPPPKSQLDFEIQDADVLKDLNSLIHDFISHRSLLSVLDKERANKFIDIFTKEFFNKGPITEHDIATLIGKKGTSTKQQVSPAVTKALATKATRTNEESAMDVDEEPKEPAQTEAQPEPSAPAPEAAPTSETAPPAEPASDAQESWLKLESNSSKLNTLTKRSYFNLFGNTSVYLFLRIYQILYARLVEVKSHQETVSKTLGRSRQTPFAVELGLYDNKLETLGLQFSPDNVYDQTISLCHRLIKEEVEVQWFEEALRQAYRNRAYKLYTIDKALSSLVKYLHAIVSDDRCLESLIIWENDRCKPESSVTSQIELRMASRKCFMGNAGAGGAYTPDYLNAQDPSDPLFRIAWAPHEHKLSFQSLAPFEITLKGDMDEQQKWNYYITSYTMSLPTEGVPLDQIVAPVLQRTLPTDVDGLKFNVLSENLQARIAYNSYKIFFEPGTSDYIVTSGQSKSANAVKAKELRSKRWKKTLAIAEEALVQSEKEANAGAADDSAMDIDENVPVSRPTDLMLQAMPSHDVQPVDLVI